MLTVASVAVKRDGTGPGRVRQLDADNPRHGTTRGSRVVGGQAVDCARSLPGMGQFAAMPGPGTRTDRGHGHGCGVTMLGLSRGSAEFADADRTWPNQGQVCGRGSVLVRAHREDIPQCTPRLTRGRKNLTNDRGKAYGRNKHEVSVIVRYENKFIRRTCGSVRSSLSMLARLAMVGSEAIETTSLHSRDEETSAR
jgi:hypothetical protein